MSIPVSLPICFPWLPVHCVFVPGLPGGGVICVKLCVSLWWWPVCSYGWYVYMPVYRVAV